MSENPQVTHDDETASDQVEVSRAEILAPGPILAVGAFAIGVGLHLLWPLLLVPTPWNYVAGAVLIVGGLGVFGSGIQQMRRVGKSPSHKDEPTELITDGAFRYTRNPLYLGILVVYLGITALFNSIWPLLPLAVLAWYFDRLAKTEEDYLEAVFGDEYSQYAETVRRWL